MIAVPSPAPSAPPASIAVIERGASTNRPGVTVVVPLSGAPTIQFRPSPRRPIETAPAPIRITPELVTRLYADLVRAGNLDILARGHCMKSASFGTFTSVAFNRQRTPDLECPQNAAERTLRADVDAILAATAAAPPP
jgi:hypothetical protein